MFYTHKIGEIQIPPTLREDEKEQLWSYVRINLHIPWLIVVYEQEFDDGGVVQQTLLLSTPEQLHDVATTTARKVVEVNLVTPGHLNSHDRWELEPLGAVWQGKHPQEDYMIEVYVIENGTRYCLHEEIRHENDLRDKHLMYGHHG